MKKLHVSFVLVVVLGLLLAACGGSGDPKVDAGKALFNQSVIGANAGCVTCHSLNKDEVINGPSLFGIATNAGTRIAGMDAEAYLRQSIEDTNAFFAPGFEDKVDVMPVDWKVVLTAEEEDNLIAFLLTLK